MAVLPIRPSEDPVVQTPAKKVKRIDDSIKKLVDDMVETMHAANGVGLAAPQVGVPLRVIVVETPDDEEEGIKGRKITLINPEIIETYGEETIDEGCLSVPGWYGEVPRATEVVVKGLNLQGKLIRVRGHGFFARALQHEVDHLSGIVFVKRVKDIATLRKVKPRPETEVEGEDEE
jgi:peptide deformylase